MEAFTAIPKGPQQETRRNQRYGGEDAVPEAQSGACRAESVLCSSSGMHDYWSELGNACVMHVEC